MHPDVHVIENYYLCSILCFDKSFYYKILIQIVFALVAQFSSMFFIQICTQMLTLLRITICAQLLIYQCQY